MSTRLTHSPADVLRWLLIDLGVGTEPTKEDSWPIYTATAPNDPDDLIATFDTAGYTEGRIQRTGETVEHPGISIQIRGYNYTTAWTKADELRQVIDESIKLSSIVVSSSTYMVYAVTRQSGPISLGRESGTNRFLFTLNVTISLKEIT